MALVFGLGSLSLATAHADDGEGGDDNGGGANKTVPSCTGSVVNACGVQIVKSVCTGLSQASTDDDQDEGNEHHNDDGRENDDDHRGQHHHSSDDDKTPPAQYSGNQSDLDFNYTDSHGNAHHVDHSQRMGSSPDGKITICHRMGGARVTLDVPDDQVNGVKAHGHGKHDMDTIGRCEDEDEGGDDSRDTVHRAKLSQNPVVTSSVTACLAAPAGTPITLTIPGNPPVTWTGKAPGCNASGVSCNIPLGGSASTPTGSTLPGNGATNRGGVRTLH